MLSFDIRALADGPVRTDGEVPADDPLFAGVDFSLAKPVTVRGRLSESGPGRSYWHGRVTTAVVGPCRRCLTEVRTPIAAELRALFAEESDTADGTATYDLPAGAVELDLAPVIREELILTVPDFVVCREDCQGLCAQCGKNLNEGPCDCRPEPDPRWAALEALRSRWADSEES